MSQAYDTYLKEHIAAVQKAGNYMLSYGIVPFDDYETRRVFSCFLYSHDNSKYESAEYDAYDDYFYGRENADKEDLAMIDSCFDYAWLHHIHANDHHWQHWILLEDEGDAKALEMPKVAVYHMIADWWSFSWKNEKPEEIFDWYENHKNKMTLHLNTRILVESTLAKIKDVLGFVKMEAKEADNHDLDRGSEEVSEQGTGDL